MSILELVVFWICVSCMVSPFIGGFAGNVTEAPRKSPSHRRKAKESRTAKPSVVSQSALAAHSSVHAGHLRLH
jgi:hypothetical protein